MNHHFELEDAPDYLVHFPVLEGKAPLAQGEFSIVFEGSQPHTVYKLTVDQTTVDFLLQGFPHHREGLAEVTKYHGCVPNKDHGSLHLIELRKLEQISLRDHPKMFWERASVIAMIKHRIYESDRFTGVISAQERHAQAIQEMALSKMFSVSISKALDWIALFIRTSPLDLLHDLCNPENYMTDGFSLIITDPIVTVPE